MHTHTRTLTRTRTRTHTHTLELVRLCQGQCWANGKLWWWHHLIWSFTVICEIKVDTRALDILSHLLPSLSLSLSLSLQPDAAVLPLASAVCCLSQTVQASLWSVCTVSFQTVAHVAVIMLLASCCLPFKYAVFVLPFFSCLFVTFWSINGWKWLSLLLLCAVCLAAPFDVCVCVCVFMCVCVSVLSIYICMLFVGE